MKEILPITAPCGALCEWLSEGHKPDGTIDTNLKELGYGG